MALLLAKIKTFMNKIEQLFDAEYVRRLLSRKILSLYPYYQRIEKVKIIPHKKHVWEATYHVVVEFLVYFVTTEKALPTIVKPNTNYFLT